MAALGFLLIIIGGLSYLLPTIGLQLKLVKLMQLAHPEAGKWCLIIGGALFVLGLIFRGKGLPDVKVGDIVPDKGDEEDKKEPASAGGVGAVVALFIVALLAGAVYVLHTQYHTFDPLLKAAHEEIQKHMPKDKGSPAPSALSQAKK
jgi:hypothetical protein